MIKTVVRHQMRKCLRLPVLGGGSIEFSVSIGLDLSGLLGKGWYGWTSTAIQYRPKGVVTVTYLFPVHFRNVCRHDVATPKGGNG